ncbi:MAG: hypothetical protein LBU83_00230 [Bacteroidales bacterium]|nr:hypothetical protein [Bacteroidales bacterium]
MNKNEFDEFSEIVSIKIGNEDITEFMLVGKIFNPKVIKEEYSQIMNISPHNPK